MLSELARNDEAPAERDQSAWLAGGDVDCRAPIRPQARPKRLLLLGLPGVGKTTQGELLSRHFGACHLSIERIASAIPNHGPKENGINPRFQLAESNANGVAPDEALIARVECRVRCLRCPSGFLLNGFPRTLEQAEALEQILAREKIPLTGAVEYELPEAELIARLRGRRVCPQCQAIDHRPPSAPPRREPCEICGTTLLLPRGGEPDAMCAWLSARRAAMAPLSEFYRRRQLLRSVSAAGQPEEVLRRTVCAICQFQ